MSSLYLADLFTDQLRDKRALPPGGQVPVTGCYPILVPEGINVGTPSDVPTLISSKYQGLMAYYGFFSNIAYDAQMSHIDLVNSVGIQPTSKLGVGLLPQQTGNTILQSSPMTLTGTPTQALFTYEAYFWQDTNASTGRFVREYALPAVGNGNAAVTCSVSFNGASTHMVVSDRSIFSIASADQGSSLVVRFTRTGGANRLFIGSWAVLYI